MALILDSTLAAAQDSASRHPLVELISSSPVADIPFDGQKLTVSGAESSPAAITTADGRLVVAYLADGAVVFSVTDLDRVTFTPVTLDLGTYMSAYHVALVEMDDGNIGMITRERLEGSTRYIKWRILSIAGEVLFSGTVDSGTYYAEWATAPAVVMLTDDSYVLAYETGNGSSYQITRRTSADFKTWSAEATCILSGLADQPRSNPYLVQEPAGALMLFFDYVDSYSDADNELLNVYWSQSTDSGVTWSAPAKLTAATDYTAVDLHPQVAFKSATEMALVYYEQRGALQLTALQMGSATSSNVNVSDMHYDTVGGKLYVTQFYDFTGNKVLKSVAKIDVATWTVDKHWDFDSVPAFNAMFGTYHIWTRRHHGEGHLVPVGVVQTSSDTIAIALLDGNADTICNYVFYDEPAFSLTANIDWSKKEGLLGQIESPVLSWTWLDAANSRLWACLVDTGSSLRTQHVGYIDLDDIGPIYTFNDVFVDYQTHSDIELIKSLVGGFWVEPSADFVAISTSQTTVGWNGFLTLWNISTGAIWKRYTPAAFTQFPKRGLSAIAYLNNKIYGAFTYEALYGNEDRRGLFEIDLTTDIIRYHRPSYASWDNYGFTDLTVGTDGRIYIATNSAYGLVSFDPTSELWAYWNNDNVPGLTSDGTNPMYAVAVDTDSGMLFGGPATGGVTACLLAGFIKQAQYLIGTKDGSWSFTDEAPLVAGYLDYEAVPTYDPDEALYAFWTNSSTDGESFYIKWDKDGAALDLADLLVDAVKVQYAADGTPNSISFSVANGHLFDRFNLRSLWSQYLRKGQRLVLRFGEKIYDTDYWQAQGTFYIAEVSLSYGRGDMPIATITAHDEREQWDDIEVAATEFYDAPPAVTVGELLKDHAGKVDDDLDLPVFTGGINVDVQWTDTDLKSVVDEIAERFGYFIHIDVNGKITARPITETADVDHTYTDTTRLLRWSPDDSFAAHTNRVTVTGEEQDYIEVLHDEERVASLAGTVGWWTKKKDYDVYYSEDKARRVRYPRLEVIESAESIAFQLSGSIEESISFVDPNDKYCTVLIESPTLIGMLVGGLTLYLAGNKIGDILNPFTDSTIPLGRYIEGLGLWIVGQVLGSVVNFQYEIWGRPVGLVRRSIEDSADDAEYQARIGKLVEKRLEGFMCYTVAQCRAMAEFELMVARLQRSRIAFDKIAHLQDEVGDTIQVPHPFTGDPVKVFITDLTRTFKAGKDGTFTDSIAGWVLI